MGRDVVCRQDLSRQMYVFALDYEGQTYAFCSMACRRTFKGEPLRYARGGAVAGLLSRFVRFIKLEDREAGGGCC